MQIHHPFLNEQTKIHDYFRMSKDVCYREFIKLYDGVADFGSICFYLWEFCIHLNLCNRSGRISRMADIDSEKERRLVADLLEGDESAFCELYALYKDRLMWFSLKFLKSRDMAEDVFQDAFASIWQNRRFLNPNVPFGPYVYTIVKNRILNLLAGLDRELELRDKIRSASLDSTNETEDSVLDTDLNALLDKALETLTPQQKRVFDMSRKDMKSHKEIADSLGISVYTVQQHISTALKVIRAFLAKYAETYMKLLL